MKNILCSSLILILILTLLCSCAPEDNQEPYRPEREKIVKVEGRQQANLVTLSESQRDSFFDLIESLELKPTKNKIELFGWSYFFDLYDEDGTKTRITVLDRYITVGGYICDSNAYEIESFEVFFK